MDYLNEHSEKKQTLLKLKENEIKLKNDLKEILNEQKNVTEELIGLNLQIQTKKEKVDEFLSNDSEGNNNMGLQEIIEECETVINKFITEIPKDKNETKNLQFKIEYGKNIYIWKIEEESTDFKKLKQDIKNQVGKQENEFFFADSKNRIYLDSMNVKNALFPFSSVYVNGFIPSVKVIDSKIFMNNPNDIIIKTFDTKPDEESVNKKEKYSTLSQKIYYFLKKESFKYLNLLSFFVFIVLWIYSVFFFRNIYEYRVITNSLLRIDYNIQSNVNLF